jgi:methylmalonyl-CoA mutase N-terminal domain/subunit
MLRFHTQTGGSTLTAQQPLNNVVRVALQAMASVLGGTQSLHTNAFDEALSLPTEASAGLALRTQQVIREESGVARTADPLGGSYFVERLTDQVEAAARAYLDRIDELGGAAAAVEYMQDEIHRSAYRHQMEIEAGDRIVVGVNKYREDAPPAQLEAPDYSALERGQREQLAGVTARRDPRAAQEALASIRDAARGSENLMPPIIAAVKSMVTLGEISDTLRGEWGEFDRHH